MIQVDENPQPLDLTLYQEINTEKYEDIQIKIQKLESTFFQCLSYSRQQQLKQNEKLQSDNSQVQDNEHNTNKDSFQSEQFEKYIAQYFAQLRSQFGNTKSISFMTSQQLNLFFEEALEQLNNKTKLYQDILKLKLLQTSQDLFSKVYSTKTNIILKQWYLHNYCYPYPNQLEIKKLIGKTQLSKKKILNWFINARNSFKRKKQKKQKYKILVQDHYYALYKSKKQSQNSNQEQSNQQIFFENQ
ncbi:unnamed protein product [Paramecium octaurelia]|uniref:Homeobox domain-containing protein n=1 Tax=Paramecium octaurelia TaxID=43137 RepID=A0A8S1W6U8_PAROT|nr:unnamed protein product [Paramecium octaurelia]